MEGKGEGTAWVGTGDSSLTMGRECWPRAPGSSESSTLCWVTPMDSYWTQEPCKICLQGLLGSMELAGARRGTGSLMLDWLLC